MVYKQKHTVKGVFYILTKIGAGRPKAFTPNQPEQLHSTEVRDTKMA